MSTTLLTIGHSTRTLAEFLALLRTHEVARVVDVRSLPRSRRVPHFDGEPLAASLASAGFGYSHLPALGGLRRPATAAVQVGLPAWLGGYAAHMESAEFAVALAELLALAGAERVAFLCAEAEPAHCHRSLIADALLARGETVEHIVGAGPRQAHRLTKHAVLDGGRVSYPARQASLPLS